MNDGQRLSAIASILHAQDCEQRLHHALSAILRKLSDWSDGPVGVFVQTRDEIVDARRLCEGLLEALRGADVLCEEGERTRWTEVSKNTIPWTPSKYPDYEKYPRAIQERVTLVGPPLTGVRRIDFLIGCPTYTPSEVWSLETDGRIVGWTGWGTTQHSLHPSPSREEFDAAWEAAAPVDRDREDAE